MTLPTMTRAFLFHSVWRRGYRSLLALPAIAIWLVAAPAPAADKTKTSDEAPKGDKDAPAPAADKSKTGDEAPKADAPADAPKADAPPADAPKPEEAPKTDKGDK